VFLLVSDVLNLLVDLLVNLLANLLENPLAEDLHHLWNPPNQITFTMTTTSLTTITKSQTLPKLLPL
jgi:hypothetical protein